MEGKTRQSEVLLPGPDCGDRFHGTGENVKRNLSALPGDTSRWIWLGLVALGAILYLPNLGAYDLWAPDEPRFGQVVREMIASGNWIVPHVNGEVYTDKPPLFFWIVGLLALLQRGEVTSFITRLPSAVAAIGGILITYDIGRRLFNRHVGALAAVILAVSEMYWWQARCAQLDMVLSAFTFLAVWGFVICYQSEKPRPIAAMAFWAGMALGTLSKGPPGLISALGGALLFLGVRREMRLFKRVYPLSGLLLMAVVLCAWLLPMNLMVPKAETEDLLIHQTIVRYFAGESHQEPWWFFFKTLPHTFLPWTVFLPCALAVLLPQRKDRRARTILRPSRRTWWWIVLSVVAFVALCGGLTLLYAFGDFTPATYRLLAVLRTVAAWAIIVPWVFWAMCRAVRSYGRPEVQLMLSWFLFTLFFFSHSTGKRDQYILVMFPSLAILVAAFLGPYVTGEKRFERKFWIPAAVLPAALAAVAVAAPFAVTRAADIEKVAGEMHLEIAPLVAIAALLALALAGALIARRASLVIALIVVVGATAVLYRDCIMYPPQNWLKSGRRLCYAIETERRPTDRVMSYEIFRAGYILFGDYTVTEVNEIPPIVEAFQGPTRVFCILRAGEHLSRLKRGLETTPSYVLWRGYTGHRKMAVVSNRPSRLSHLRGAMRRQASAARQPEPE